MRHLLPLALWFALAAPSLAQAPVEDAARDPDRVLKAQQRAGFAERERREAESQVKAAEERLKQAEAQYQEAQKRAEDAKRETEAARKELEQAKAKARVAAGNWEKASKALEEEWLSREKMRSGGKPR